MRAAEHPMFCTPRIAMLICTGSTSSGPRSSDVKHANLCCTHTLSWQVSRISMYLHDAHQGMALQGEIEKTGS